MMMEALMVTWWRLCFDGDLMEALLCWWLGWWRFCFDDVLVDGGFATLMIWRQFLFYTLPASWSLPPLRVGFLKPLLVGSKRRLAGPSERVGTLISVGAERSTKIEVFHIDTIVSMNNDWVFHLYLVHIVYLVYLLLCMKDSWMWHMLYKSWL